MEGDCTPVIYKVTPESNYLKKEIKKSIIVIKLPLGSIFFNIEIGLNDKNIILVAEDELYIEEQYYQISLSYERIISLGKCFRICDNISEVAELFKTYVNKAINKEKNFEIFLSQSNQERLELHMKIEIVDKPITFSLSLFKAKKDNKIIIEQLKKIIYLYVNKYGKDLILEEFGKNVVNACSSNKFKFNWKEGTNYTLDKEKLTAKKINGNGWTTVVGNKIIPKNSECTWKINLVSNDNKEIDIGICPSNINPSEDNYKNSFCYCTNGYPAEKGKNKKIKGLDKKLNSGDIVGVKVNTINNTMFFSINNGEYIKAFENIPKDIDFIPTIGLQYEGNEVKLID